ncbi:MAG: hypothetical protein Q7U20_02335 [Caulobacter sp.]|nr:hypothetical protein [Caulobacter sp.]
MRILLGAVAALALSATAAFAGDEVLASRFGNTTITTDGSGQSSKIYYEADHSFTGVQGEQQLAGTWAVNGSQVCLTFSSEAPPGYPNPICTPVANHAVGETWTAGPFTVQLVAGHQ